MEAWNYVLERNACFLRDQVCLYDLRKTKVAVIVEPRRHALFEAVVRNAMQALGPDEWNLHVFAHDLEWVKALLPGWTFGFTALPTSNLTRDEYDDLLKSASFWQGIRESHIVIFQTDVIFLRPGVEEFARFDYAGANYFNPRHTSKRIGGIQGGFSVRRRQAMLDCLLRVTDDMVRRELGCEEGMHVSEDVFFTIACDILCKDVPSIDHRKHLAIEAEFFSRPVAHHGTQHAYFTRQQYLELLLKSELLCPFVSWDSHVPGKSHAGPAL